MERVMRRRLLVMALSTCAFSSGLIAQTPTPSATVPEVTTNGRGETLIARWEFVAGPSR